MSDDRECRVCRDDADERANWRPGGMLRLTTPKRKLVPQADGTWLCVTHQRAANVASSP